MYDKPLVVDLDGTLLKSDLLLESATACIAQHPWYLFKMMRWLLRGKAYLKSRLASLAHLDITLLPYDTEILEWLKTEKAAGRTLVLATASNMLLAQQVADHLKIFDEVIASDHAHNLKAAAKRDALIQHYGTKGFDYVGNAYADLVVWMAANQAYVVNPPPGLEAKARALGNVLSVQHTRKAPAKTWLKALRCHQWLKNLLLFVPMLAGHKLSIVALLHGSVAFVLFGLCASSVYLLNDILDLQDDRHHSHKRYRALASGAIPIQQGVVALVLLLIIAFGGALLMLPWAFTAVLCVYYCMTLAYSLGLKRLMVVDVIVLTLLYTLRIIAGTCVFAGGGLTFWLLAFSIFIFLSLALVKRYTELHEARKQGKNLKTRGRGYYPEDLEMIASLGASSGYISVMVLALYIQDPATIVLYRYPQLIWLACPLLLFWISRTWILSHRGQMSVDPVIFAIKDRVSLMVGALFGIIFWLAA